MKKEFVDMIESEMLGILTKIQIEKLKNALYSCLHQVDLIKIENTNDSNENNSTNYLKMFLAAKNIEGCSEKTIAYYYSTIYPLIRGLNKDVQEITTEDLRCYLAQYQEKKRINKVTLDNVRRIFSSFFSWLEDEDYIIKSPVRRIHKVKEDKTIKDTLTDENIEILRDNCAETRDLALIDLLNSTGMRVGELVRLNTSDIDFNNRECIVFGKGNKERKVYFDAKTKVHLKKYLESRIDEIGRASCRERV